MSDKLEKDDNDEETSPDEPMIISRKLKRHRLFFQIMATTVISWMAILQGYATAYTSPADESMRAELKLDKNASSWISSCLPIGALIGCLFGIGLLDLLGRKLTLILADLSFLFGWIANFFANNNIVMYISRLMVGFGVGVTSLAMPVYLAEIIHHKIRGRLSLLSAVLGNFGILLCFSLGNLLLQWRGLAFIGCLLPLPFLVVIWCIPETPHWLLSKKKWEKARNSLQWLRGPNYNIEAEFSLLNKSNRRETIEYFTPVHIRAFLIVMGLMFFQQFTGINAVIFYATHIFEISGSDLIHPALCTAIVGVVNFISTFITALFVDRLGRKVLLYISSTIIINTLTILGVYFYLLDIHLNLYGFQWIPLIMFAFYILGFSLGFGPLPWLIMAEVLPITIRGPAASLCAAFNWTCTFIIIKMFPVIAELVGIQWIFWFFAIVTFLSVIFLWFLVPETKKKTLEEIERFLLLGYHQENNL